MARAARIAVRILQLAAVLAASALLVSSILVPVPLVADRAVALVDETILDVPPLPPPADHPPLALTSYMVATDGTFLAELHGPVHRVQVALSDIPAITRQAVIATEDASFYEHRGVDHRAIVRAAITNYRAGEIEEGASTITQQYVRAILLSREQTLERKITEAVWAVDLERQLTKDEILERYLNTAYFGNGVYGIGTASEFYFSRHISDLGLAESALLAGLIRGPERYNPLRNPDAARIRRDIVLSQMVANGFITAEQGRDARTRDLGLTIREEPDPVEPFFVEWVKRVAYHPAIDLQPELQTALGADPDERLRRVLEGGVTLVTTLDPVLDRHADNTLGAWLTDPVSDPLGGLVTLEAADGAIRAMAVGPKRFGDCPPEQRECEVSKVYPLVPGGGGRLGRQPGSAFKPFVAAAALSQGVPPGWETTTESGEPVPGCGTEREPYAPHNYSRADRGPRDMYSATQASVNVYFVKLARAVGVSQVRDVARRLGIEHSPNLDEFGENSCSIALGTANVYPLEMAAAYATIANDGVRCRPYVVARVEDRDGAVLYEHQPDCEQAIDPSVAHRLTDILQGPPSSAGTAPVVGRTLGRPVAGKTGTTSDWRDAWFVGFVPQYATAAWVGYELPTCPPGRRVGCGRMLSVEAGGRTWRRVTGGSIPAHMWADYMALAVRDLPVRGFPDPGPVAHATVPKVVGTSQDAAVEVLQRHGFQVRLRPASRRAAAGTVVQQRPQAGTAVERGSLVVIDVSDGSG
ncbi:MAG: transglycosylase domain-containing protein [Actinomycetota bacterium]|nr:transglycosylase domain-containing protein [Actinomycetota bacterium]